MKKVFLLFFLIEIPTTFLFSQYDQSIFEKVSKSMNFDKWDKLNSISLVFDHKQKKRMIINRFQKLMSCQKRQF